MRFLKSGLYNNFLNLYLFNCNIFFLLHCGSFLFGKYNDHMDHLCSPPCLFPNCSRKSGDFGAVSEPPAASCVLTKSRRRPFVPSYLVQIIGDLPVCHLQAVFLVFLFSGRYDIRCQLFSQSRLDIRILFQFPDLLFQAFYLCAELCIF